MYKINRNKQLTEKVDIMKNKGISNEMIDINTPVLKLRH